MSNHQLATPATLVTPVPTDLGLNKETIVQIIEQYQALHQDIDFQATTVSVLGDNCFAMYDVENNIIYYSLDAYLLSCIIQTAVKLEVNEVEYFQAIIAHEIGHAKDAELKEISSLINANDQLMEDNEEELRNNPLLLKHYMDDSITLIMLAEMNAWKYGKAHTLSPLDVYDSMNQNNIKGYEELLTSFVVDAFEQLNYTEVQVKQFYGKAIIYDFETYKHRKVFPKTDLEKYEDAVHLQHWSKPSKPVTWYETEASVVEVSDERLAELMLELEKMEEEDNNENN